MENFNLIGKQVGAPEINLVGRSTGYADPNAVLEPPSDGGFLEGFGSDIKFAITNPSAVAGKMRSGAEAALSGIQKMRADELERQGSAGLYGEDYANEVRKSSQDLEESAKTLSTGIDEVYTPKSGLGQFASNLTQSVPAALAGLASAVVAGPYAGIAVGMGLGGGQVYGSKYLERRNMGDDPDSASSAATIHALAEMGSELIQVPAFVKLYKAAKLGKQLTPALIRSAAAEGTEEVLAGLIQGSEDSFRGAGVTPEGWSGALEYFKSGKFLNEAVENFAGGFVMGGVLEGSVMKPIQLSYKPKAVEAVKQMDQAIKAAEATGSSTVQVGDTSIPIGVIKEKMGDTVEAFGIKPEEWTEPVLGQAEQDQAKLDNAIAGLRELVKVKEVEEGSAVEEPTIELTDVVSEEAAGIPQAVDTNIDVETGKVESAPAVGYKIAVSKNTPAIFGNILEEIYAGLDFQPDVSITDVDDYLSTTQLPEDNKLVKTIAATSAGKVITLKNSQGETKYLVVGRFKGRKSTFKASIVMHEALGHIIDYEFYDKAPQAIKDTVDLRFKAWLKGSKAPEEFLSPDILMHYKERGVDLASLTEQQLNNTRQEAQAEWEQRKFREFKAQQISAAMQKRPEVRSVVERFWANLYKRLQVLYNKFKADYLDVAANVGTMDEFVEWLYSTKGGTIEGLQAIETVPKSGVENFNVKLDPLVEAIYNSLFEMVDGKRVIKDKWRFKRLYKDGTSGKISRGDIQRSGYSYKELFNERKTIVTKGKDQVLFTIPWDSERGLTKDSARMIAVNVRDLLILSTLQTPKSVRKSGRSSAYNALLANIDARAKQLVVEEGISLNQARLNIMAGKGSAFSKYTPGILGTPEMTERQADKTLAPIRKDIQKLQSDYPGLFNQLYGDTQSAVAEESGDVVNQVIELAKDEQPESLEEVKPSKTSSDVDTVIEKVVDIVDSWYNKPKPSERVRDFDKLVEKVIFYFDHKGKDYTEISVELRNLINITIKDTFQQLTGEAIQKDIQNKSVAIDKVLELQKAGADTTLEEIELRRIAQDMGMLPDDDLWIGEQAMRRIGTNKALGFFKDPIDGFKKAFFVERGLDFKTLDSGVKISIGNGKVTNSIKLKAAAGRLVLGDLIQAPNLFTAYPVLETIKVKFGFSEKSKISGSADWNNKVIKLNALMPSAVILDTLVHEMQHIVQAEERWAGGASPDSFKMQFGEGAFQKYLESAGEEQARRTEALYYLTDEEIKVGFADQGMYFGTDVDVAKLFFTDPLTGESTLSVIKTTEDSANDELLFASYKMLNDDSLDVGKPKIAKRVKVKSRPARSEGIYADILKQDIKPRKLRARKTATVEQIEKRRQKTVDFITRMDVIKAHAEKNNLSIAEVMQKAGFDSKEIRRSITKYHSLKSKFTQNEMILRLSEVAGLINEETGRDGLVALIQVMFPPVDGETGSDGTLQGLTSVAKDILINQIQNIILAKEGSKYDIETEQTLAELGKVFQDEYNQQPGWKKAFSLIKFIQSSAGDFLQSTKPGQALAYKLRKFLLEKTIMQRDYLVRLNEYGQKYRSVEQREKLYEVISGVRKPANAEEQRFLALIHKINAVFGREMESLGVKIYKKDGSFTYFKYAKDHSLNYFPHMWKPEWFRNPTEQMIQSVLDSNEAVDREHAKRLIQKMGKDRIRMSKFANIEMERETELGGWITDPIEVYTKYIQNATRRLAALKIFGENPEVSLAQYSIRHFKESRDPDAFTKSRDLINRVLGNRVDDALLKEPKAGMSIGVMFSVGLLLQHAMLVQPGVIANMGAMAGYKNLIQGISKVLPSLWGNKDGMNNKRWAELSGVLAFTVNRELNDIVMEDEHRTKSDRLLRAFGITQMDGFLRIIGAIVGKVYATDTALRYIERQSPRDAKRLRNLGIDPSKLSYEYLQTSQWFAQDLRMAALAFTEDTNFVIDPLRAPSIVQGHPMGKIFMLFKNFAFQQHRMLMGLLRDKEFGKFIAALVGSLGVGSVLYLLKILAKGEDPEKTLKEDGLMRTIWRAFVTGGGPGLFVEAIGSAATASPGRVTGMSLDSPALGLIEQGARAGGSLYDLSIGEATQNDLNQLYRTGAMAMQGIILSKAPAHIGVPVSAAIGVARPMSERYIAPSESQEDKRLFQ